MWFFHGFFGCYCPCKIKKGILPLLPSSAPPRPLLTCLTFSVFPPKIMGSRRQLCGQAGLSLSSGNTTSTSSGSNNNSTRLIHLCRRQAAEQHRKRVEHFQPQQQQSPAHSGISVNSNSSFILNSKNNTHEDMRQEDQVKTTSASRALFSSTRLWVRDQILPYVVAETPYIMEMQV